MEQDRVALTRYQLQTCNLVNFFVRAVFEITLNAQLSFSKLKQKALETSKIIFNIN